MPDYPYMPLWTDAFVADTQHLDARETGAYLLLIMAAWRRPNCDLPDDDRFLARLARLEQAEWQGIKEVVMAFWSFDGRSKTWHQKRARKERSFLENQSQLQRDRATKGWEKRKKGDAAAMPDGCRMDAPTPTPTPTPTTPPSPSGSVPPHDVDAPVASAPSAPPPDDLFSEKGEKPPAKKAHRLPDDWRLSAKLGTWALDQEVDGTRLTEIEVRREAEKFRDHWHAKGGADARKVDWEATWRNWVRRALGDKVRLQSRKVEPLSFEQQKRRREIEALKRQAGLTSA